MVLDPRVGGQIGSIFFEVRVRIPKAWNSLQRRSLAKQTLKNNPLPESAGKIDQLGIQATPRHKGYIERLPLHGKMKQQSAPLPAEQPRALHKQLVFLTDPPPHHQPLRPHTVQL